MKNFKHPNVLSVFGVCLETSDGVPFIVLPYMPNGDLRNYLKSRRRDESNVEQFPIVSFMIFLSIEMVITSCVHKQYSLYIYYILCRI